MAFDTSDIIQRPPGHARILGTPRSGKTSLLVERFHHLSRAGHQPLVIAFGRDQRDRLLERLIPSGTARFGAMPVTTHGLLAGRLLSAARPNRSRTLRDVDERVVLDRVLTAQPDLMHSDLRTIAGSSTLRDALLQVLHRLAQNGVTAAQTDAVAKKTGDARAGDVLRLFAAYCRHLGDRHLVTFYDAAWEASRAVTADRSLLATAGVRDVVLVDDFHDLDAGQFALLRAVAPPGGPVALEVFGDPTGARFSFRGTSERFLMEEFSPAYRPAEFELPPARPSHAALAQCLSLLTSSQGLAQSVPNPPLRSPSVESLPLFATPAPASDDNAPEWDLRVWATIARDEVAEAQHAALCVRDWIAQGMAPGDIVVVARDPERVASLVHHAFRERGVPINVGSRADSAADTFVYALVGALGRDGDGRFTAALEASPLMGPFCATRELPRDTARAVAALRKAYSSRGVFDLEHMLQEHVSPRMPVGTIERVAGEWNRYAEVVAHSGGQPALDEFRRAYLDAPFEANRRDDVPRLLSARAASGTTFSAAVVVGCADGIFPRVEIEGGYIPLAHLADALSRACPGAARDFASRVDRVRAEREEAALLLSALVCARGAICLSHPRKSGDQAMTIPPLLAPLFENANAVERDISAAFRASAAVTRAPADAGLASAAHALEPMAGGWIRPALPARRPVFDELALSPSRLQTFTDCERKFFFSRVLRIEDPGSIYLTIGRLFHDVLREIVSVGASGDEVRAALASDAAHGVMDRAIAAAMPEAGEWVHELTKVHMRRMLDGVIALEESRNGGYRVLATETEADYPDASDRILTGRVDRIDHVDGLGPVVVDYKTSKKLPAAAAGIVEGIEEARKHWQIIIYSALAAALGHDACGFLYYVVPPGEDVNAVGVQLKPGRLVEVVHTPKGKRRRYEALSPGTLQTVLDEAMKIHANILSGACTYARTDDLDQCGNCHFITVCRRSNE